MDVNFFEQDLSDTEPQDVEFPLPPYEETNTVEEKLLIAYHCLQRSIRLKSRTLSLVNAYYTGKALNEEIDPTQRKKLKKKLTKHYRVMSENCYDLFEVNPLQMLRTKYINVLDIRRLKRRQILFLRNTLQG